MIANTSNKMYWLGLLIIAGGIPFSCTQHPVEQLGKHQIKVVEAKGYVVPKDSMASPKVVLVDEKKLPKIQAVKPNVVPIPTNIHPAGKPKVVPAGTPRICTPGKDGFLLPKTVSAIDSPFVAGLPTVVRAKDAYSKDQNPQNFRSFNTLQGLTDGNVNCVIEDKGGNLWVGTENGGLSKYDGQNFTHFTEKEGLSNKNVVCILEDKSGNLWIGTWGGGVTKYDGQYFTHFTEKEGLSNNQVESILEDKSGNLWFATWDGGVSKYDGQKFTHFTEKEGLSNNRVWSILEDKSGNLWFGTASGGVSKYDGQYFTHFTEKEGLSNNGVWSMLEDKSGNLWFGTAGAGVSKYDGKTFTHFTDKEGLSNNTVRSILEDKSGNLWFSGRRGVSKYDGKTFTHFTSEEGLSNNNVRSILEDKSGNLWFGTWGGGIIKYGGQGFTHFTRKEGLNRNYVNSIQEDKSGNLWFGGGGSLSKYDGQNFTHFTEKEALSNGVVESILEDKSGNLWMGTWGGGITKYDGKTFTHFTEKERFSNNGITSILEDKSGNLWFANWEGGVSKYDGHGFTYFTEKEGLSDNSVWCILEDKSGNLWFGTRGGGVSKYDGQTFTHFTEKEGLSNNDVRSILEDKSENLWFGTWGGGVSKYDGKTFTHFTEKEGLSNNDVRSILEDKSGNLWFGTRLGLSELTQEKQAEITAKIKSGTVSKNDVFFTNYTHEDGFLGIGVNSGKAIYQAKNGDIWIGANDRLTILHPEGLRADTAAPNIQLTGVALYNENIAWVNLAQKKDTTFTLSNGVRVGNFEFDGLSKWYNVPQHLSLAYNNNYLSFQYVGITLQAPGKVKYQCQLEGLEDNWNAITTRTEATYGNLPPGTYTFKVKARNSAGVWSREFRYTFTIRPPWWKTWWAYGAYLLLLAGAGWRLHLYQRERTIKKEREKAQARELEQAKAIEKAYTELELAHETLQSTQAQLIQSEKLASLGELTAGIAHEIQNPLNFVNNFAEVSAEMLVEMDAELDKGDVQETKAISADLQLNLSKINHHGQRASSIVKGMLEHSRASTGIKEPTDLNAMADEYLRLAYHGLRAKDNNFNATLETHFDPELPLVSVIPQDIGRVLLNLINNAFYAVAERSRSTVQQRAVETLHATSLQHSVYQPTITVSTQKIDNQILIKVKDNGPGIPDAIREKIFQPFFTTKPTGQGTGLGLSLAYDIVIKGHGGTISLQSETGEGTTFSLWLPI